MTADAILADLRQSAIEMGDAYVSAIAAEDYGKALGCAQLLLTSFSKAIPLEDEFNNAHVLLVNLLWALTEVGAGRFKTHPILKGRLQVGGVGQLSAAQEDKNGIGAGAMWFLIEHQVAEDTAANLVAKHLGVGNTAPKDWIGPPKRKGSPRRKLLVVGARLSLERIKKEYEASQSNNPVKFADHWLGEQMKAMKELAPSPR